MLLGLGAGWAERDDTAYGSPFGTADDRLRHLERGLAIIKGRCAQDPPVHGGAVSILIGGGGDRVTLRLVARFADLWNGFGPLEPFARKNRIRDEWCARVGRDPAAIERTVRVDAREFDRLKRPSPGATRVRGERVHRGPRPVRGAPSRPTGTRRSAGS